MQSFENNLKELQQITAELERKDTPLERGIEQFKRGSQLIETCLKQLSECRGKITIMQKQLDGLIEMPSDDLDAE